MVAFLYDNAELGFKPTEMEDHLELPHEAVTQTLTRLHGQGLIGKTTASHYHALDQRRDLHRYVASLEQTKHMFETLNKDYEEHTDIESPETHFDKDEIVAELAELEAERPCLDA